MTGNDCAGNLQTRGLSGEFGKTEVEQHTRFFRCRQLSE